MSGKAIIAGGGIGGLAAALAISRAGWRVQLIERNPNFSEFGAGVQLGPNVTRVLQRWGLNEALGEVAAYPDRLHVFHAVSGREIGMLRLGKDSVEKYGAPYAALHRADLQQLLLQAVQRAGVQTELNQSLASYEELPASIRIQTKQGMMLQGDALIGADGLWSRVRELMLADGQPRPTGHLAYRALLLQTHLPEHLKSQQVKVWLGPHLHVVQYPVRRGEWLNVVVIAHGKVSTDLQGWDHDTTTESLHQVTSGTHPHLQDLIKATTNWRLWSLCDRRPMQSASEHACVRVALVGDAAHPMRPYLAQGAGMAIEDADCLGQLMCEAASSINIDVPGLLKRYANSRWQRNARVQKRALRNGRIFHLTGLASRGRDLSISLLGERLLDMPWLYRG
jgi:salicylate hydroxylase